MGGVSKESVNRLPGQGRALGEAAETNGVAVPGECIEIGSGSDKIPGGSGFDLVSGLSVAHEDGHGSGGMIGIELYVSGRHAAAVEQIEDLFAVEVSAYATSHDSVPIVEGRS